MKFLKYLLPLALLAAIASAYGQNFTPDIDQSDIDTFRAFLERKETGEEVPETGLRIGGDVRAKYFHERKKTNGFKTRGEDSRNPVNVDGSPTVVNINKPQNDLLLEGTNNIYEVEANLEIEYAGKRDWAEIRIRYKNLVGVFSGEGHRIRLMRAWMGYDIYDGDYGTFDIELGRYNLGDIFESRIEFDSEFDGILLTYGRDFKCVGDFFIHGGPFVINFRDNHFGWAAEAALLDVGDTGLYLKYSYIDWRIRDEDQYGIIDSPNLRFQNSQFLVGYRFIPEIKALKRVRLYGAYLINHAAQTQRPFLPKKDNIGWYAGVEFGKLDDTGDWLFDICYQYVGYLAVSHYDCSGGGRGNKTGFDTDVVVNPSDPLLYLPRTGVLTVPYWQLQGNSNFKGWLGTAYYQLTEHLTLKAAFKYTVALNKEIGGGPIPPIVDPNNVVIAKPQNTYRRFELSAIYDF